MSRELPLYSGSGPIEPALSRREFVSRSMLAAVAASLATACGGAIDPSGPSAPGPGAGAFPSAGLSIRIADFPALATVGAIARVDGGAGLPVAVTRLDAGSFAAFSMVCPHAGSTINISGSGFVCPNHGARFSAAGAWTGGQSTSNLVALPATFDAATGILTIAGAGAGGTGGTGSGGGGGGDHDDD